MTFQLDLTAHSQILDSKSASFAKSQLQNPLMLKSIFLESEEIVAETTLLTNLTQNHAVNTYYPPPHTTSVTLSQLTPPGSAQRVYARSQLASEYFSLGPDQAHNLKNFQIKILRAIAVSPISKTDKREEWSIKISFVRLYPLLSGKQSPKDEKSLKPQYQVRVSPIFIC